MSYRYDSSSSICSDVQYFLFFIDHACLDSVSSYFGIYLFLLSVQVSNQKFCSLGLNPITVEQGLMDEVANVAGKYQHRCDRSKVLPSSFWNKARAQAASSDGARLEDLPPAP